MARNSLGRYYSASFKMPDLRRVDLAAIEEIILRDLKPDRYHVAAQGFEYDRVEDIPKDAPESSALVIYTHAPCLRIKLARSWAELYCEQLTDAIEPGIRAVSAIVGQRQRVRLWKFAKFSAGLAPLIGFGTVCEATILISFQRIPYSGLYAAIAVLGLCMIWWGIGYRATLFRFSRIDFSVKSAK